VGLLFSYYTLRPGQLRCWHPGYGVVLGGDAAQKYLGRSGYGPHPAGVAVTRGHLPARTDTVRFIANLLRATAARPARLNCFGLHEWAMVYRAPSVRHAQVPLRLGAAGTDTGRADRLGAAGLRAHQHGAVDVGRNRS
jgi:hypothetical protein